MDHIPTNTRSFQGESQLNIFEDNEAVIKMMIIKGRSPAMRHVSRTHRVALDWLFDRIDLEPKIQIKYVDTKNQLADILTKGASREMSGITFCVCLYHEFFSLSLSQSRERLVIGAMSKPGQDMTSSDGSPVAKARLTNLVMQVQCKVDVSPQRSGSPVNMGNDNNRQRVGLGTGNWRSSDSNFEVESTQVHRQEKVNLARRKLGQKDQTRVESEENSSGTRKLDASLPDLENKRFSDHQYMEKIFQCVQKKLGRTTINATFSVESYTNNVFT